MAEPACTHCENALGIGHKPWCPRWGASALVVEADCLYLGLTRPDQCFNCGRKSLPPYQMYEHPNGDLIELCASCTATYRSGYGAYVQIARDPVAPNGDHYQFTLNPAEFEILSRLLSRVSEGSLGLTDEEEELTKKLLLTNATKQVNP